MTTDKGTKTMSASLYFYVLLKIYCKTTVASSPSNKDSAGQIRLSRWVPKGITVGQSGPLSTLDLQVSPTALQDL